MPGGGNRLLESVNEVDGERERLAYEPGGAPLARDGLRYEYDAERRPVRVFERGTLLAEYAYNGFGERIRKVVYRGDAKRVTYFLYDGHTLSAEIDAESGAFAQSVYLENVPIVRLLGERVYAVHGDHLGTPRLASDEDGRIVWQASYTPFGEADIAVAEIGIPQRLPGQYADAETGTHYNYLRDYDPATGRYLTSDPIGLKGGWNTYAYAGGNRLGRTDVLRLAPDDDSTQLSIDGVVKPVAETGYTDKLKFVLIEAAKTAGAEFLPMIQSLLEPEALFQTAIMMGAITALQAVPGLNALVDAGLLGWAWWNFGNAGLEFLKSLIETGVTLARATSVGALCESAGNLGVALAGVGGAALDIVDRGRGRTDELAARVDLDTPSRPPDPVRLRRGDLPPDHSMDADGNVIGPEGGIYRPTGVDANGSPVYENGNRFYTFDENGKRPAANPNRGVGTNTTGPIGERHTTRVMQEAGWTPLGGTQRRKDTLDDALPGYQGQTGIDGIFTRPHPDRPGEVEYVIVETKSSVNGSTGGLETMTDGRTVQMSDAWIRQRLEAPIGRG